MFTYILYGTAGLALGVSFFKDRKKTRKSLLKAWKSFENILPEFLFILLLIGLVLSILSPELISKFMGKESGWVGMCIAAAIGCFTLIPSFVAYPLAASLLQAGAGYGQIAMFVTTLMMVGVVSLPVEQKYFGKKLAIKRNLYGLIYSTVCALIIGGIM